MEHLVHEPDRRRFLGRLVREVSRAELMTAEHAAREARRIGEHALPAIALHAVAAHAEAMKPRFITIVSGYDLPPARGGIGTALAALRDLLVDRIVQAERAYRIALFDLRQGVDVVKLLREAARGDERAPGAQPVVAPPNDSEQPVPPANHAETRGGAPPPSEDRPTSHDQR